MSELDVFMTRAATAKIRAYKVGNVPTSPAYPYAVLSLTRVAPDVRRLDGGGNNPRRLVAQMFDRTADGIEDIANKMLLAFDAVHLPEVAGEPQCRVEVTTPPYRDPDDNGVLNATHTYRY